MLAARNLDVQNPLVIDGIKNVTAGAKDAYLNEGGRMAVYQVTIRRSSARSSPTAS